MHGLKAIQPARGNERLLASRWTCDGANVREQSPQYVSFQVLEFVSK
jgi:hypothetical protein